MTTIRNSLAAAVAVAGMALTSAGFGGYSGYANEPTYSKSNPRPKSKHKRKHKGSKAAKKASRKKR